MFQKKDVNKGTKGFIQLIILKKETQTLTNFSEHIKKYKPMYLTFKISEGATG